MNDINLLINNGIDVSKSLEILHDMEIYNETLKDFVQEIGKKIIKIKEYKEMNDMSNYGIYVHSLKSDSDYLGFKNLSILSENHERECKVANIDYIETNYIELINEVNRITDITSQYLGVSSIQINSKEKTVVVSDKKILIADDSNIIRNFVEKSFDNKVGVLTAADGKEAINTLENDYDGTVIAMLLDLNMPEVDGYEVLKYMEDNNLFKKIPVSIITGDNTKETVDRVFKYPIIDLVEKPFSVIDIKTAVEKLLAIKNN